jgi:hypothetical protein
MPHLRPKALSVLRPAGWLTPLVFLPLPLLFVRNSLSVGFFPGLSFGESWGRLFVSREVGRWLGGEAPVGVADLLEISGRPFWPVDASVSCLVACMSKLLGGTPIADAAGLTFAVFLLFFLAGLGPWLLARTFRATAPGSLVAGIVAQAHPYLLLNAEDGILEALAIGVAALAAACFLSFFERRTFLRLFAVAAGALILGCTSPYLEVYLAAPAFVFAACRAVRGSWKTSVMAVGAMALGSCLAAAPLLATESGQGGRLGPSYSASGYHPAPGDLGLFVDNGHYKVVDRRSLDVVPRGAPPYDTSSASSWTLQSFPDRLPRGIACGILLLAGLVHKRSRLVAGTALAFLVAGPGPVLLARALDPKSHFDIVPIQILLQHLPLLQSLGNPQRMVLVYVLFAAVGGAAAIGRWRFVPPLILLTLLEAWISLPGLDLPATQVDADVALLSEAASPAIFLPLGDGPVWNPAMPPKRTLYLASIAGLAVAGDYGRGGSPADLPVVVALSAAGGLAVGSRAAEAVGFSVPPDESVASTISAAGFKSFVLLKNDMRQAQAAAVAHDATRRWGAPAADEAWGAVWLLP